MFYTLFGWCAVIFRAVSTATGSTLSKRFTSRSHSQKCKNMLHPEYVIQTKEIEMKTAKVFI